MQNKELYLPMSTKDSIISDKSFPIRLYGKMTLDSNYSNGEQHRYIYNSKIKSDEFKEDLKVMNISESTLKRQMSKLKKHTDLIELIQTDNGIAYKLKYKDIDNGQFVTIKADTLRILLNTVNDTTLKLYLVLLYALKDKETGKYVEKQITQDWLLNKLGLKPSSRQSITDSLFMLDGKFINVNKETKLRETINKNGNITSHIKTHNYIRIIDR